MKGGGFVKRYMRIDEVAEIFEVTPRTVRNWWLSGKTCLQAFCPEQQIGSRGLRFTRESVQQFEQRSLISPEQWESPCMDED